ncbi:cation diffusion facilitator family transporter [Lachnospiraceae bacterium YH-ros2228]
MITILEKILIKSNTSEEEKRALYGRICGIAGLILNLFLFIGKMITGLFSGSISIIADALNNLSDFGSSLVTMVGFKMSEEKPDPEHPFGHGRIEYIAGFIVSTLILIMAFELIKESLLRLIHPKVTVFSPILILVLSMTILVKFYMAYYNRSIGRKIQSPTIQAVAIDSLSDCISTSVVILTTLLSHYSGIQWLDAVGGLFVGVFVLFGGVKSAKDTLNPLLGTAPDPEFIKEVRTIMREQDKRITGIHDLIVHDYGPGRRIVSLHAEVPADGDIIELHDIIDHAERELENKLHCTATIHMDPIVTDDPRVLKLQEQVLSILQEISPSLSMHDFRTVPGSLHTTLVFDVLMPFGFEIPPEELDREIQQEVHRTIGEKYICDLHFDTDYTVQMVKRK